ncbi:MAG: serine hydrolase [Bacteroidota bacterium]
MLVLLALPFESVGGTGVVASDSKLLSGILDEAAASLGTNRNKWEAGGKLRLIFVQIDRQKNAAPVFTYHTVGMAGDEYFNPASMVKLPLTFLTLERVNEIKRSSAPWIEKKTRLEMIPAEPCQTAVSADAIAREGYPNLAQYIRRILTVSDNPSYNRLFDFLGQETIRRGLLKKGYDSVRIKTRFSDCSFNQNRYAPYIRFYDSAFANVLHQPASFNTDTSWLVTPGRTAGKGYMENRKVVWRPKDFSRSNEVPLNDELDMLLRFVFPESFPNKLRWDLSAEDRAFLFQYLSVYPSTSGLPEYADTAQFPRFLKKYFLRNASVSHQLNDSLRVFNIVGLSYGFISDVSYVIDLSDGTEFFLAATMIANENGVVGDGKYDYETIAFPLYGQLFDLVYEKESKRKKDNISDFREIREALSQPLK